MSEQLNNLATQFNDLGDRVERGSDALSFVLGFWEKYAKIELTYSKSLEELCGSRTAKLQRMFGNVSIEHVVELDALWKVAIDDIRAMADQHRVISENLHTNACTPLNDVVTNQIPNQTAAISIAKKVIQQLKSDTASLQAAEKKYQKVCREYTVDANDVNPSLFTSQKATSDESEGSVKSDDALLNLDASQQVLLKALATNKESEAALYKTAIEGFNDAHVTAFTQTLPKLLKSVHEAELQRVNTIKKSIQVFTELIEIENEKMKFTKTRTELERVTDDVVSAYTTDIADHAAITFVEPSISELFPNGDIPLKKKAAAPAKPAPPKVEQAPQVTATEQPKTPTTSSGGFFSSLFGGSKKAPPKAAEVVPATTSEGAEKTENPPSGDAASAEAATTKAALPEDKPVVTDDATVSDDPKPADVATDVVAQEPTEAAPSDSSA